MWKSPVGAQESQPRLVYKAELKTLLSLYRALVLSILIAPWESSSRRLQKKIARWRFSSSQTLAVLIAVVSSLCFVVFCYVFVAGVVLISACRLCILRCLISLCAVLFCSSTSRVPPLDARRSSRSTTIRNCNHFTLSFFLFLVLNFWVFLLVLRGVRVLCFERKWFIEFVKLRNDWRIRLQVTH